MPAHLVIDGYNLLGVRRRLGELQSGEFEQARERLLRDLAAYRQRKGHAVTVVFDGWQQGLPSERHEHRAGIEVIYSRRGERADQVIVRLAEEFGRDATVVTNDREIVAAVSARGSAVLGAHEFDAKLAAPIAPKAGAMPYKKLDEDVLPRDPHKKGNPRKLPKAARKRQRFLRGF